MERMNPSPILANHLTGSVHSALPQWAKMADGTLCYLEIPAPDLQMAQAFYSVVFGWKVSPGIPGTDYLVFSDKTLEGGFNPALNPSKDGVKLVLKVRNIEAKLREIEAAGGTVVKGRTEVGGGHGLSADFVDPNGNLLSIWSRD